MWLQYCEYNGNWSCCNFCSLWSDITEKLWYVHSLCWAWKFEMLVLSLIFGVLDCLVVLWIPSFFIYTLMITCRAWLFFLFHTHHVLGFTIFFVLIALSKFKKWFGGLYTGMLGSAVGYLFNKFWIMFSLLDGVMTFKSSVWLHKSRNSQKLKSP